MLIGLHFELFRCYFALAEFHTWLDAPFIQAGCKWYVQQVTVANVIVADGIVNEHH